MGYPLGIQVSALRLMHFGERSCLNDNVGALNGGEARGTEVSSLASDKCIPTTLQAELAYRRLSHLLSKCTCLTL
jgi:hypothetical protein